MTKKKRISVASRKAKARWLQDKVVETFRKIFNLDHELTPQDDNAHIKSKQMGGSGVDVVFSPTMKKITSVAIECKNQSRMNIPDFWRQTRDTAKKEGLQPMLVVKYPKFQQPFVIVQYEDYFKQYGDIIDFALWVLNEYDIWHNRYAKAKKQGLTHDEKWYNAKTIAFARTIRQLEKFLPMRELDNLRKQFHNETTISKNS